MTQILHAQRLYLRPLTEWDATEAYAGWINDSEVNRYLTSKSATPESLRAYIQERMHRTDVEFYGIFLNEGDTRIGTIKLEPLSKEEGNATIGIMIGEKAYWGGGYGPEAMRCLMRHAFEDLELSEIRLGVIGQNERAVHAFQKLGFHQTHLDSGSIHMNGETYDKVLMVCSKHGFIDPSLCADAQSA